VNAVTNLAREAALDAVLTVEMSAERRPIRMAASTFTVWRVLPNGKAQPHPVKAETLAGIEREIASEAYYGATMLVRETATISGQSVLHSYRIRRGKATWGSDARKIYPHVADKLFSVDAVFEPVEPWRCVAGADRVGLTNIIEGGR
jgi:hypothetical protein